MARRQDHHDPLPIPNGWFAVAWSRELHEGDVRPIHYFGDAIPARFADTEVPVLCRIRPLRVVAMDASSPGWSP